LAPGDVPDESSLEAKMEIKKSIVRLFMALAIIGLGTLSPVVAADWRTDFPGITLGVISEENPHDRLKRWTPFMEYMAGTLAVFVKWYDAKDYEDVIQALKNREIQLAWFGPASFAQAWLATGEQAIPLAAEIDQAGGSGYYSVIIVKHDSPFNSLADLKGKRFGFADPESTSGFHAPKFFLIEQGINPYMFFGTTAFSGNHEESVKMLYRDQFDAVATWWTNDNKSNMSRMVQKGIIEPGGYRIIWTSPKLPADPFTVPAWLPEAMQQDILDALLALPQNDPAAFKALMGNALGLQPVSLEDYQPIIRLVMKNIK
jgi:phosphonate transport system substrate-binding protein